LNRQSLIIAARWIFPISSDPIEGGWVRMEDDQVVEIGHGLVPVGAEDLGDAVLLPGLVNAHTHLEFSDLASPIGDPGMPLHDWIGLVVGTRRGTTAESKNSAIEKGLIELYETGTRLVAEITTPPCSYTHNNRGLELIPLAEVLGLDPLRASERFGAAMAHNEAYKLAGLSPHAPYSTSLPTVDRCVEYAIRFDRPLAMHVAESPDERELLSIGGGPFAEALQSMGVWRDGLFPWGDHPLEMLIGRLAKAPRALMIHGNHLNDQEIEQVSQHKSLTVVYCPRTHSFFRHEKHPVDRMLAAGVRVALGTDSRASNPDLNLWSEVQHLLIHRPDLDPAAVLSMATISGADALGRTDLGRIEVGARPGLGYVKTAGKTINDVYDDLTRGELKRVS